MNCTRRLIGKQIPCVGLLFILLSTLAVSVQARMYQWNNPDTGTTQLSGTPPPWYRSETGGPRVFVFEKGQLIDDTARRVPEAQRRFLREQAVNQAAADEEQERSRELQTERAFMSMNPEAIPPLLPPLPDEQETAPETDDLADTGESSDEQSAVNQFSPEEIEAMRALIMQWENERQRQAKKALDENNAQDNTPGLIRDGKDGGY